jgi:YD repeat-containing protein
LDPEWKVDTVVHKWIEYFPFKVDGAESTYIEIDTAQFHYNYHPSKPTQVTEYPFWGGYDSIRITNIKYDKFFGDILYQETRDRAGNVYRTEYRYYSAALLHPYSIREHRIPFETIVKKNGKVIAATVVQDTVVHRTACTGGCPDVIRPKKVFTLASVVPLDDYQPANADSHNRQPDSRCKLVTTYRYDSYGRPVRIQNTGELPVFLEWDDYDRLMLRVEGAESSEISSARQGLSVSYTQQGQINYANIIRKRLPNARITSYTYNLYGQTSVTDPSGYTLYTEYDVFGQPTVIKDDEGNIRQYKEYQYGINP